MAQLPFTMLAGAITEAASNPKMADPMSFTPVGDIVAMALCILMFALVIQTYIHHDWRFNMLIMMLVTAHLSAGTDIGYHMLLNNPQEHLLLLYSLRLLRHILLASLLFQNLSYLYTAFWITSENQKRFCHVHCLHLLSYHPAQRARHQTGLRQSVDFQSAYALH